MQLRTVGRSPARVSHETNQQLLARLGCQDPLAMLSSVTQKPISLCRTGIAHIQPELVKEWWTLLLSSTQLNHDTHAAQVKLTDVSLVVKIQCHCPHCDQRFPSTHALRVHMGKSHPEKQPPKTQNTASKNKRRYEYRAYALHGMPQCRLCLKRFHAWPEFMGHISQRACPFLVLQDVAPHGNQEASKVSQQLFARGAPAPEELPTPTAPEEVSSSEQPELAKQGDIPKLSQQVRQSCSMQHCPECYQWVAKPRYLVRHAVQSHSRVRDLQSAVKEWLKNRSRLQRPCEFCDTWYQARPKAHLQSCPVLWISLHLMARHHNLLDPGQTRPPYGHAAGSATAGGPRGAGSVLSASHPHHCHDSPPFRHGNRDGPRQGQARVGTVQDGSSGQVCQGGEQRRQAADGPDGQGPILHSGPESRPAGGGGDEPEGLAGNGLGIQRAGKTGPQPTKPGPRAYRQGGNQTWWGARRNQNPRQGRRDRDSDEDLKDLVKQRGRLVLRLEDAQTIASLDTQFIMFICTASDHKGGP